MKRLISIFLSLFLIIFMSEAQEFDAIRISVSTNANVGIGENAPFWLTANRQGLSTTKLTGAYARFSAIRPFDEEKKFSWSYGADVAAAYNYPANFIVQQLYADVHFYCWQLSIGSKERWAQGKNPLLSTGGMTWSGNARPIPQVRFGIEEYTSVPFTSGWAHVKGFISYGKLTDNRYQRDFVGKSNYSLYTQNTLFHEKSAFLKIGNKEISPLSFEIGLEMNCMFGGELWEHSSNREETETLLFTNPSSFKDYLKAIIPLNGGENSTYADQKNAAGNHFGSIHFAGNYQTGDWGFRAYYEHYFDGRTGMTPWNATYDMQGTKRAWIAYPWFDGLTGIEITLPNQYISSIVAEYNTTRDQCGSIHHTSTQALPASVHGFALYYYNSSYPAYQHWGMTAGSPLLFSPAYNKDGVLINAHTRVSAYHLGMAGKLHTLWKYRLLGTFVRSWGSYIDPLLTPANSFSTLAETTWTPSFEQGWDITAAVAFDRSAIVGNNTGIQLAIKKTF
ncbi:MAG: hypothetical protein J6Y84_05220 [Bacteroidaceae bacterium]|nr:hypothetical protein [Bacteroidaceae bacterium]